MTDVANLHRIAIIGAGYMAAEHARAFASWDDATIVGIVGRSAARAEALASEYGCSAFPTIGDLHASQRPDAVIIAVPELACRNVCEEAFPLDWVVLAEKPVGHNLAAAESLLALSQQYQRDVFVALNRRSYSATRHALSLFDDNGGRRLVVVNDTQDLAGARAMGQPEEVCRNYMFANSLHLVDYLRIFGRGAVKSVDVTVPWNGDEPGPVVATVHFESGDVGLYHAIWDGPGPWSVTVTDMAHRAELRPLEQLGIQRPGERSLTMVERDEDDISFKPGLRWQARQLLDHLSGRSCDLATLDDATESMRLVGRIYA